MRSRAATRSASRAVRPATSRASSSRRACARPSAISARRRCSRARSRAARASVTATAASVALRAEDRSAFVQGPQVGLTTGQVRGSARLGRGAVERRQLRLARGHLAPGRLTLGREALQQRGLPGAFARAVVRRARGRSLGILGHAAGAARLLDRDAGALQPARCLVRRGERHRRALGGRLERVRARRASASPRRRARRAARASTRAVVAAARRGRRGRSPSRVTRRQPGGRCSRSRRAVGRSGTHAHRARRRAAVPIRVPAQAGLEQTAPLRGDGLDEPIRLAIAAAATAARRRPG